MRKQITALFLTGIACASVSTSAEEHPVVSGPSTSSELVAEITDADRILFDAVFNNCDLDASQDLVTDDFEFYHDKWGKNADSGAEFLSSVADMCEGRQSGRNVKARRELVADSVKIYPLNNFGAIQIGTHKFYGLPEGKEPVLRETGQFTHVWQKVSGKWKLARVLSYDHKPAQGASE
ncbi:nuclear transport factor 2 family protein [Microbulbifer magnicolonia]|uniref:nuclear transport factor 2 family protein n=1 Tax=Microbulbifer magnicolonia TaxID=3109744 RepID=UPI002B41348D|nr:nuclear transport factor 2 family protein [Microbulbifer sp. GG15]